MNTMSQLKTQVSTGKIGIYMIRRSFIGTSHPVHVMRNFGMDARFLCELNDCRELSSTAKRSGNLKCPICCKKFQFPLHSTPRKLEALINKKVAWFKREREEECLKLHSLRLHPPLWSGVESRLIGSSRIMPKFKCICHEYLNIF